MIKYYISLLFIILNGCSSKPQTYQLIKNLDNKLSLNHQIQGSLIAKYDLLKIQPTNICLYDKNYVKIINDIKFNYNFINIAQNKLKKNDKLVEQNIVLKIKKIAKFINNFEQHHHFLDSIELKAVNFIVTNNISQPFKKLVYLDNILKKLPINAPLFEFKITSHYGYRQHPLRKVNKFHTGIDLAGKTNSIIYSAADGKIINVDQVKGYGKVVDINHGKFISRYAHLSQIIVKKGEFVFQGQKIGFQGKSGYATNEHLHFEVFRHHKHFNPINLIKNPCIN